MANTTTVGMTENGQFLCTLPKGIAQAMRLSKGNKIEFIFDKGDVIIRKI